MENQPRLFIYLCIFKWSSFKINQHSLKSQFSISRGCRPSCAMVRVPGTKRLPSVTTPASLSGLSTTRWAWNRLQKIKCFPFYLNHHSLASESSWSFNWLKSHDWLSSMRHEQKAATDCVTDRWLRNLYVCERVTLCGFKPSTIKAILKSQLEPINIIKKPV